MRLLMLLLPPPTTPLPSTSSCANTLLASGPLQLLSFLPGTLFFASYSTFRIQFKYPLLASLVVQWLRICLVMQGTWVQSLAGELKAHTLQSN